MAAPKVANRDEREEIQKVFALFDDDGTGGISFRNLKRVATELGENLTDEELQEMIGAFFPPFLGGLGWGGE